VLFDWWDAGGAVQGLASIPEILWEASLGIYAAVWGFGGILRFCRRLVCPHASLL
jgi:hypothetical protein